MEMVKLQNHIVILFDETMQYGNVIKQIKVKRQF